MNNLPNQEKIKQLESTEQKKLPKKADHVLESDNVYSNEFVMKIKDPIKEKHNNKKKTKP